MYSKFNIPQIVYIVVYWRAKFRPRTISSRCTISATNIPYIPCRMWVLHTYWIIIIHALWFSCFNITVVLKLYCGGGGCFLCDARSLNKLLILHSVTSRGNRSNKHCYKRMLKKNNLFWELYSIFGTAQLVVVCLLSYRSWVIFLPRTNICVMNMDICSLSGWVLFINY